MSNLCQFCILRRSIILVSYFSVVQRQKHTITLVRRRKASPSRNMDESLHIRHDSLISSLPCKGIQLPCELFSFICWGCYNPTPPGTNAPEQHPTLISPNIPEDCENEKKPNNPIKRQHHRAVVLRPTMIISPLKCLDPRTTSPYEPPLVAYN